jgi:hypothetical protein
MRIEELSRLLHDFESKRGTLKIPDVVALIDGSIPIDEDVWKRANTLGPMKKLRGIFQKYLDRREELKLPERREEFRERSAKGEIKGEYRRRQEEEIERDEVALAEEIIQEFETWASRALDAAKVPVIPPVDQVADSKAATVDRYLTKLQLLRHDPEGIEALMEEVVGRNDPVILRELLPVVRGVLVNNEAFKKYDMASPASGSKLDHLIYEADRALNHSPAHQLREAVEGLVDDARVEFSLVLSEVVDRGGWSGIVATMEPSPIGRFFLNEEFQEEPVTNGRRSAPDWSKPMSEETRAALEAKYPEAYRAYLEAVGGDDE